MIRAVVFGALGMLGRDVVAAAAEGIEVVTHDLDCDITDPAAVKRVLRDVQPGVVINCAAYTAVDKAEQEPESARLVNGVGPGLIGREAAKQDTFVVHFSTDYVFDGAASRAYTEEDPPHPLGVYGTSKLEGERALAATGADHVIVRTAWLYGWHGRSFPRTMWQRASGGEPTRVVSDQYGRPTSTRDLARATWQIIAKRCHRTRPLPALLHVTNTGAPTTWHGIAERVFKRLGQQELLTPCESADYPTAARRPAYSVLETARLAEALGPLPSWQTALDQFLDLLAAESG